MDTVVEYCDADCTGRAKWRETLKGQDTYLVFCNHHHERHYGVLRVQGWQSEEIQSEN